MLYLDSSALVKLVVSEPESDALLDLLRVWPVRISSALALTEVPRAIRRAAFGPAESRRAREVLARVNLVEVDRSILSTAAAIDPAALRTLDAIHLATALTLREDLHSLITYDHRLATAARRAHLEVLVPA